MRVLRLPQISSDCPVRPIKHLGDGVWICKTRWGKVKRIVVKRRSGARIHRFVKRRKKRPGDAPRRCRRSRTRRSR